MGYQALLFCPDDKTARTVTQVLSELEFTVEACIEPFAAVKKLMGQHFDAVVVDCDNEQNATLLFKSARNSTSNQTSLAVAVVEGQAGVAKAFRIGANLVLTKPINIEQAKGTLRVARGLLRKSEPAKPGAPATTPVPTAAAPTPTAVKPPVPKPIVAAKPATLPPKPVVAAAPRPAQIPTPKPTPTPAWPAHAAAAGSAPVAQDDDLLGIEAEKPAAHAAPVIAAAAPATSEIKPTFASPSFGAAASAPAPAREPHAPVVESSTASAADSILEKPAESTASESAAYVGSAPSFSFGGATSEPESSGGNKKVFIGIAAAVVLAAAAYFGWSHFQGGKSSSPEQPAPVASAPAPKPSSLQPAVPAASTTPATAVSVPNTQPAAAVPAPSSDRNASEDDSADEESTPRPSSGATKSSAATSSAPSKTVVADKTESNALVVKGGKGPAAQPKAAAADAPAPSVIGMAAPSTAAPNLGSNSNSFKPVLQTLSISQGVSTGLLYKKVAPTYPANALRLRIEGAVELQATISKEGTITHIKVLSGDAQLTKAATDAVKQWKYKPYLLNGEPVEIQTQITVNFKIPH